MSFAKRQVDLKRDPSMMRRIEEHLAEDARIMSKSVITTARDRLTVEVTNGAVACVNVSNEYQSATIALTPAMVDELIEHLRKAKSDIAELRALE